MTENIESEKHWWRGPARTVRYPSLWYVRFPLNRTKTFLKIIKWHYFSLLFRIRFWKKYVFVNDRTNHVDQFSSARTGPWRPELHSSVKNAYLAIILCMWTWSRLSGTTFLRNVTFHIWLTGLIRNLFKARKSCFEQASKESISRRTLGLYSAKWNKPEIKRLGIAPAIGVTILKPICRNRCDARHHIDFDKLAFV
jgi:hypothetical protein